MLGAVPFRAVVVFHAVASTGSVRAAAARLNITPSAVSQQTRLLEEHLGVPLFTKSGRTNLLTEAGERYFDLICDSVCRIENATVRMRGVAMRNGLTVRSAPTFATKWLMPRVDDFLWRNPDIDLRIDATTETTDFDREGVDLDIRYGEGRWPGLHCEPVAEEQILPLCSPSLAAPNSLSVTELLSHRIIYSVKALVSWESWLAAVGVPRPLNWRRLLFDRSYMAVQAATDGLGVALESDLFAEKEIRSGALVCPLREPPHITIQANWIVCPPGRRQAPKVRKFREWLQESVAGYPADPPLSADQQTNRPAPIPP